MPDEIQGTDLPVAEPQGEQSSQQEPVTQEPSDTQTEVANEQSKWEKDSIRLKGTVRSLQQKLKEYEESRAKPEVIADLMEHPAIKDLPRDDTGHVEYEGMFVTPEFAIKQVENAKRLEEVYGQHNALELDTISKELAQAQTDFERTALNVIIGAREEFFPHLEGQEAKSANEMMIALADMSIRKQQATGVDILDMDVAAISNDAAQKLKTLIGGAITAQANDNQKYRDTVKAQPNGTPGVPVPTKQENMSVIDRAKLIADRVAMARNMRRTD